MYLDCIQKSVSEVTVAVVSKTKYYSMKGSLVFSIQLHYEKISNDNQNYQIKYDYLLLGGIAESVPSPVVCVKKVSVQVRVGLEEP